MEYSALSIFHDITNAEVDAMIQCFRMRRGGGAPPGGGGAGPV